MVNQKTKEDLIKKILETDLNTNSEEELIHLLIKERLTKNINRTHSDALSIGDKLADKLSAFVGSWIFICSFIIVLGLWITANLYLLENPFDPYPFILLNLVLSCVAAIQAPAIMMSQNRQEQKDRMRAENDYKVNLKSELIIEDLHNKIDTLLKNQEDILVKLKKYEDMDTRNK